MVGCTTFKAFSVFGAFISLNAFKNFICQITDYFKRTYLNYKRKHLEYKMECSKSDMMYLKVL